MDFLKKLHKEEGKTIIMVTHDARTSQFAERVEVLKDGKSSMTNSLKGELQ